MTKSRPLSTTTFLYHEDSSNVGRFRTKEREENRQVDMYSSCLTFSAYSVFQGRSGPSLCCHETKPLTFECVYVGGQLSVRLFTPLRCMSRHPFRPRPRLLPDNSCLHHLQLSHHYLTLTSHFLIP